MSHDMARIAARLHEEGYRVTPQRQLILDAVCALGGHVTPEAVYERVQQTPPAVNRATVYRSLHFLAEMGILAVANIGSGRFGYEMAGEERHHHLVCRRCGATVELPQAAVRRLLAEMEAQHDFAIQMNHITFLGLCANCRDKE